MHCAAIVPGSKGGLDSGIHVAKNLYPSVVLRLNAQGDSWVIPHGDYRLGHIVGLPGREGVGERTGRVKVRYNSYLFLLPLFP